MKNFLNKALWVSFIFLSPMTLLGLFSQNSIPGEILYPIKLGIEKTGSLVFAFTPESHASYNTALTERRFEEAQALIIQNSNTTGLTDLVEQTQKTALSTSKVEDPQQKKLIEEKLIRNITQYQQSLTQTQQTVNATYQPVEAVTIQPSATQPHQPTVRIAQPKAVATIVEQPTPTPTPISPKAKESSPEIIQNIEETKKELEEIKKQILQNVMPQEYSEPSEEQAVEDPEVFKPEQIEETEREETQSMESEKSKKSASKKSVKTGKDD
ncbi:MAG: DUF5667 domain-containing protein [Candidatus Levybacteria bacterium]|nr:DUF5667 domain-containing protein [Candidatus Levybacteria bacterium]